MGNLNTIEFSAVVLDNNILMDLYELELVDLIKEIFKEVYVHTAVWQDEALTVVKDAFAHTELRIVDFSTDTAYKCYSHLTSVYEYRNLSTYDKLTIALAVDRMCIISSNDGLMRKACKMLNIKCIGILGVVRRAYNANVLTKEDVVSCCLKLVSDETTCYISDTIVEEFLKEFF